jgi:splicing factor U2AF subunit
LSTDLILKTNNFQGIAFCEFVDPSVTNIAIQGLNGMVIGEKNLRVQKASIGITQVSGVEMGVNAMSMLAGTTASGDAEMSRVVQLLNMVTPEELMDNDDYEGEFRALPSIDLADQVEICEDVEGECSKFGQVVAMKVPRPIGGSRQSAGVGKIYIKFDTTESAKKALQALAGRKFADRTVVTTYFPEVSDPWPPQRHQHQL